jgi:hypothetical protein
MSRMARNARYHAFPVEKKGRRHNGIYRQHVDRVRKLSGAFVAVEAEFALVGYQRSGPVARSRLDQVAIETDTVEIMVTRPLRKDVSGKEREPGKERKYDDLGFDHYGFTLSE